MVALGLGHGYKFRFKWRGWPSHALLSSSSSGSAREIVEDMMKRVSQHSCVVHLSTFVCGASIALKPLFSSLNTRTVFRRLTYSVLPRRRLHNRDRSRNLASGEEKLGTMEIVELPDLYSPIMLVITQAALLRPYEEKLRIPFIACLIYWLAFSIGLFLLGTVLAVVASPSRPVARRIMPCRQ